MSSQTVSSGGGAVSSSADRLLCGLGYVLLGAAPFTAGITGLAGGVLAMARTGSAEPLAKSHWRFQTRIFWIAVVVGLIGVAAMMFGGLSLIYDIFRDVGGRGQGWDAWDLAAVDERHAQCHPGGLVGAVAGGMGVLAAAIWAIAASMFGLVRLLSDDPIGRRTDRARLPA